MDIDSLSKFHIPLSYRQKSWLTYTLVLVISIIPLFYNLGGPVLAIWDESRNAVNSYEMLKSGNMIVTQFNGEPDLWNTKPPLLQWLQVLSMKMFGMNEWALRLPSALAALILGFVLIWFSKRYLNSNFLGLISVLILYTSNGYVNAHSIRTADFDSLLVLFTAAASFFLFFGTETKDKAEKRKFILGFFLFLTLGALTKGIAAFIMGPAYFIYLLIRRDLLNWLRNPNFWVGTGFLVIIVGGYYFLRNYMNPGYLEAMIENEITGRYMDGLEENKQPFPFYFRLLYQMRFQNWYFLVPVGILLGYLSRDVKLKRLLSYLIMLTLTYLLVISKGETKLLWYDLPVFPYLSIMAAMFFYIVIRLIKNSELFLKNSLSSFIPFLLIVFFFAAPYADVFERNRAEYLSYQEYDIHKISKYLREAERGNLPMEDPSTILYEGDFQHFLFYVYQLREEGYEVEFKEVSEVEEGKDYIVYHEEVMEKIKGRVEVREDEELMEGIYLICVN